MEGWNDPRMFRLARRERQKARRPRHRGMSEMEVTPEFVIIDAFAMR